RDCAAERGPGADECGSGGEAGVGAGVDHAGCVQQLRDQRGAGCAVRPAASDQATSAGGTGAGEPAAGVCAVDRDDGGGRGDRVDSVAAICGGRAGAVGDGVRVQHSAAADQGCALPGRADGEREQPAADAAGMVCGGGVPGAAVEPADELLDDRVL